MSHKPARKSAPIHTRRGPSVVIAYLHPGQCSAFFTASLADMLVFDAKTAQHIVGRTEEWSSANISGPRNSLTAKFLDRPDKAEWLLWIDSDMAWEHDALDRMLATADPVRAPIVGGLCFGASLDRLFPTIYQVGNVDGKLKVIRVDDFPPDAMVQCAATGAAFLLIHRTVLEAMRDRNFNATFPWFQETELDGRPVGEDITFGLRAGQLGYPVHVNTAVKVGHHKSHLLTDELFQQQKKG